jgi:hypothetical protein
MQELADQATGIEAKREMEFFEGKADEINTEFLRQADQTPQYYGVNMKMQVPIDMGKGQSSGAKSIELSPDLIGKFTTSAPIELIAEPCHQRVGRKAAFGVDEMGNALRRELGLAAAQHQMKAHCQSRVAPGEIDGFLAGFAGNHQAGTGEDAVEMGLDDGLIDCHGETKVVSIDDSQLCPDGG